MQYFTGALALFLASLIVTVSSQRDDGPPSGRSFNKGWDYLCPDMGEGVGNTACDCSKYTSRYRRRMDCTTSSGNPKLTSPLEEGFIGTVTSPRPGLVQFYCQKRNALPVAVAPAAEPAQGPPAPSPAAYGN